MNPLLKHSIALALSTAVFSSTSYAATCSLASGNNWTSTSWSGCAASGPVTGDNVYLDRSSTSLNGLVTPVLNTLTFSVNNTLNDAGASTGHLSMLTFANFIGLNIIDFTTNNSLLTIQNSGISTRNDFSSTFKFGTGTVKLGGDLLIHADSRAPVNVHGKFTMNSGGTLEFTAASTSIKAYRNGTNIAVITLQGTSSTPLVLKSAGTTTFIAPAATGATGAGTYNLDYVHFATGTWVVDPSVTITEPPNCTAAAGATPPAAWTGCTASSAVSASVNLNNNKKPELFSRKILLE